MRPWGLQGLQVWRVWRRVGPWGLGCAWSRRKRQGGRGAAWQCSHGRWVGCAAPMQYGWVGWSAVLPLRDGGGLLSIACRLQSFGAASATSSYYAGPRRLSHNTSIASRVSAAAGPVPASPIDFWEGLAAAVPSRTLGLDAGGRLASAVATWWLLPLPRLHSDTLTWHAELAPPRPLLLQVATPLCCSSRASAARASLAAPAPRSRTSGAAAGPRGLLSRPGRYARPPMGCLHCHLDRWPPAAAASALLGAPPCRP